MMRPFTVRALGSLCERQTEIVESRPPLLLMNSSVVDQEIDDPLLIQANAKSKVGEARSYPD